MSWGQAFPEEILRKAKMTGIVSADRYRGGKQSDKELLAYEFAVACGSG